MYYSSHSSPRWKLLRLELVLFIVALLSLLSLGIAPQYAHAQNSSSTTSVTMSDTIRAAILKDPRSANLTEAQLDAMVSALSNKAQAQGVTPQAIAYRPGTFVGTSTLAGTNATACSDISSWLCPLGMALGYDTPNKSVPIGLWITSGMLAVVIWEMRKHALAEASAPRIMPPSSGPLG